MIRIDKIHHKNQVLSMKGITTPPPNTQESGPITSTKVVWQPVSGDYTM